MATYVMLTRLAPEALTKPESVADLNKKTSERIKRECPTVRWVSNYAVLDACDCIDIFEAPDAETATKAALLVR
ncbi:MAG: GYD domain-containing protein [Dehalococcoidia bacterium]|nr:GYD domain-containing protein [Dehalococcoidia bacterium]